MTTRARTVLILLSEVGWWRVAVVIVVVLIAAVAMASTGEPTNGMDVGSLTWPASLVVASGILRGLVVRVEVVHRD